MNKIIRLLLLIFPFWVNAQNPLTLSEAIRLAKANSPLAHQIAASYKATQWSYKAGDALRRPQVSLEGSLPGYSRRIDRVVQPDGSFLFRPVQQAFSFANLEVTQNILATGGNVSLTTGLNRQDIFGTENNSQFWQGSPILLSLNQPLFRFNRLKFEWKQRQLQLTQATRQQLESLEELSINTTVRFFNLHLALLQQKNAELNLAINDTTFKIAKGRFGLGKIAENELLQVELSYTNARNQVEQQKLNILVAEKEIQQLTGPIGSGTGFNLTAPLSAPLIDPNPEVAIAEAKANRSDYVGYQIDENDAKRNLTEASLNRKPQADLSMSYGLNQTGNSFNEAYQNPLSAQFGSIGFSMPIANFGKNRAEQKAAEFALEARKWQIEQNRNNLEMEVYNAVLQLKQLKTSLVISAKADTIAQKRYEVTKNRYLIGTVDITNLLIAQNEKDQALLTYINTLRDYWVAYFRLRRLTLFDFETQRRIEPEKLD